jgi:hypothetical protein
MININDTLTLDDNCEYVVLSKANLNNLEYYYLINLKDKNEVKICYFNGEDLIESFDKNINTRLLQMFLSNLSNK